MPKMVKRVLVEPAPARLKDVHGFRVVTSGGLVEFPALADFERLERGGFVFEKVSKAKAKIEAPPKDDGDTDAGAES